MRSNIISLIGNLEVIVSGDGQSDSPGHSAKYLTYFVMLTDAMQDYIVHLECLDKREVGGKSPCMEKAHGEISPANYHANFARDNILASDWSINNGIDLSCVIACTCAEP